MAENNFMGLLQSPGFRDFGLGLLSQSGPVVGRPAPSLGQAIGRAGMFSLDRGDNRLRNDLIRQRLTQQKQQQDAMNRLQGLLGDTTRIQGTGTDVEGLGGESIGTIPGQIADVSTIQTPQGQQEMLGLLAQAAPAQTAQGLLGQMMPQERSDTSLVRNLEAAGIDPSSEEGQNIIRQNLAGSTTDDEMDRTLKMMQIESLNRQAQQAETEKERKEVSAKISVTSGVDRLREVAQINNRLRNTMGETGLGFSELKRMSAGPIAALTSAMGGDAQQARQVAADLGRFEQLTTSEAVQGLFGGEVSAGTITDAKLNTFLQTKPGMDQLPETNNKIIADMLQSKLDSADKLNIALPDREEIEAEIKMLRGNERNQQRRNRPEPVVIGDGVTVEFIE